MEVEMVAKGRNMKIQKVRELADGRVYTGRMALKIGLVDEIGGERQAKNWLINKKQIDKSLPVLDIQPNNRVNRWLDYAISLIQKTSISERLILDGLVSVWHPRL